MRNKDTSKNVYFLPLSVSLIYLFFAFLGLFKMFFVFKHIIAVHSENINSKILYRENIVYRDEMAGWHHQLDVHEFEQVPGDGDGQGSLECCGPWGGKELDTTEKLN